MVGINSYLIDPPLFGKRHAVPLFNTGLVPTRGQAIFIGYLLIINIVLSAVGYQTAKPGTLYPTPSYQITSYISNRLGVLSFANLPLLIFFSGRNTLLVWMTDWSR